MPQLSKEQLAKLVEPLAQKLAHYSKLHTQCSMSSLRLKMNKIFEVADHRQCSCVRPFDSVDGLLAQYDRALERQPTTYEDVVLLQGYAFSAAVLFNEHKVYPVCRRVGGFKAIFDRRLAQLNDEFLHEYDSSAKAASNVFLGFGAHHNVQSSKLISAPALATRKITQAEARALVADCNALMRCKFVESEENAEVPLRWRVASVSLTADMSAPEYSICVEEDPVPALRMRKAELLSYLMASQMDGTMAQQTR